MKAHPDRAWQPCEPQLELLWVDDPVDAFFLQIQGSGASSPDGAVARGRL